jgi:hypothetical protein
MARDKSISSPIKQILNYIQRTVGRQWFTTEQEVLAGLQKDGTGFGYGD